MSVKPDRKKSNHNVIRKFNEHQTRVAKIWREAAGLDKSAVSAMLPPSNTIGAANKPAQAPAPAKVFPGGGRVKVVKKSTAGLSEERLDFWATNNFNVILSGKHGTGKTARVIETFNNKKLNWLYFSAATMDPWIDFIGVPRETQKDGLKYLELVKPRAFATDEVEAIFFDEFNRAPKKVKNAVMELIQFKSINGVPYKNLKMIWAAVNPFDDSGTYDVEKIDPAQLDRFHIQFQVPYQCDLEYFENKFGNYIAQSAISWWNKLPKGQQDAVSPRRLDYALEIYTKGGDLRDCLPKEASISQLRDILKKGPIEARLEEVLLLSQDDKKLFINDSNIYTQAVPIILKDKKRKLKDIFLPLIDKERLSSLISENTKEIKYFCEKAVFGGPAYSSYKDAIESILSSKAKPYLIRKIRNVYEKQKTKHFEQVIKPQLDKGAAENKNKRLTLGDLSPVEPTVKVDHKGTKAFEMLYGLNRNQFYNFGKDPRCSKINHQSILKQKADAKGQDLLRNTLQRKKAYLDIIQYTPGVVDQDIIETNIKILQMIYSRSRKSSIGGPNFLQFEEIFRTMLYAERTILGLSRLNYLSYYKKKFGFCDTSSQLKLAKYLMLNGS